MKKPLLIILISLLIPSFLMAQEAQKPKKYENPEWYRIGFVKYKAGKKSEALKLIKEHWRPVGEKLGRNMPVSYEPISGEWDMITLFPLADGMSGYEWETSAAGIAWDNEFTKQAGGEEKAKELQALLNSYVQDNKQEIVKKRVW